MPPTTPTPDSEIIGTPPAGPPKLEIVPTSPEEVVVPQETVDANAATAATKAAEVAAAQAAQPRPTEMPAFTPTPPPELPAPEAVVALEPPFVPTSPRVEASEPIGPPPIVEAALAPTAVEAPVPIGPVPAPEYSNVTSIDAARKIVDQPNAPETPPGSA